NLPASKSMDSGILPDYSYRMDYPEMGECVIINNKNFHRQTGMLPRSGTDADAASVREVFMKLGYKIKINNDLSCRDIFKLLKNETPAYHLPIDSIFIASLSKMSSGRALSMPFTFSISRSRFQSLIHACSPEDSDTEIHFASWLHLLPHLINLTSLSSTGYYSWRNSAEGSWFIQSLCKMLKEHARKLELMQILTRVNRRVAEYESCSTRQDFNAKKQIPCIVSMLTKEFYFPC
ncbi:Caspase-3, partial [Spheniscus demersus]